MGRKAGVREKIDISGYGDGYIEKSSGDRAYFFSIEPSNLSVLSEDNVRDKIESAASLGRALGRIEYLALDDRENYSKNRFYIQKRMKEEKSPEIKSLLLKDERFIKQIEADASSARRFLIGYRVLKSELKNVRTTLGHFQSLVASSLMKVQILTKQDIQEVIAMYFHQDTATPMGMFEDYDGENYYRDVSFERIQDGIQKGEYAAPSAEFDFMSLYGAGDEQEEKKETFW